MAIPLIKLYIVATMKRMIRNLPLTLLLLAFTLLHAQDFQYEGEAVSKISVIIEHLDPGDSFDAKAILSRMKTREGEPFLQSDFDDDLKLLSQEYDRVDPDVDYANGQVSIHMSLTPKARIRSIQWEGNNRLGPKALRRELDIRPTEIFDRKAFNEGFAKVKEYYVKKGYYQAQLDYSVVRDPATGDVDIIVNIDEGPTGRIKNIIFTGFTKSQEKLLKQFLGIKKYRLVFSIFTGEGTYAEQMRAEDEMKVLEFLQDVGYADARVEIKVTEATENKRLLVEIIADKGEVYHFGNITVKGNELFSDDEAMRALGIREGSVFSPRRLHESQQALADLYGSKGYIDAMVAYMPHLDEQDAQYHVDFEIEEGNQYRVGMINIMGNTRTQNRVILLESPIVPGEVFNARKLTLTEDKLTNIGYFDHVNVYSVRSSGQSPLGCEYRDVNIEVEECSTGNASAGLGFSTADKIGGNVALTERNFNISGLPFLFSDGLCALRGAGEYAQINATVGQRHNDYSISWAKPFFMDTCWIVGFDIDRSINRVTSRAYETSGYGTSWWARYPFNQYMRLGLHYRLRYTDLRIRYSELGGPVDPRLVQQANNSGTISAVGAALNYDSTDNIGKPTKGLRSSLQAEYTGIWGDFDYGAVGYTNTLYYSLDNRNILKFRADAKFIFPTGSTDLEDIPLDERLFLGGETSVRGFRTHALGPVFSTGEPSGGLSSTLLSVEHVFVATPWMDIFTFVDSGQVSPGEWRIGATRSSVGYGARLYLMGPGTPPITIGMGHPIKFYNKTKEKKFFLSMAGTF